MNKFIDEEKNMLENDPEIRDPSLRRKPSFFEKLLWNGRRKSTTLTALAIAVTAIVCALSACAPQADEEQQKAYASYVAAFEKYQTAVNEYNKLEVTDKPALPQSLVITNDLDAKATAEQLNSKNETLTNATAEINGLIESLKNKQAQQAAYQNYLLAWNDYESAANAYESLENPDKPDLSDNLVFSKTLNENSSAQELNQETANLQNATAEINKLIKQYEQETPTPPEPPIDYDKLTPADLTEEQKNTIVTKVTTALEANIAKSIPTTDYEIVSMEFYTNESKQGVARILFNYTTTNGEYYDMRDFPMNCELSYKNLLTSELAAADKYAGDKIINFGVSTAESRASKVLAKLNPELAETNPGFISLTKSSGPVLSIGGTSTIILYIINKNGITKTSTYARSDGDRVDPIGQSILADTAKEGTDYTTPTVETFEFGDNVILLGEMFNGEQAQEYENVDAEINGVRYAIIRNHHTVYNEALKEPESY